jgi:hypothetical protein
MATFVFALVVVALLATKALDAHSTWRRVGVDGETNPLAAGIFRRVGLGRGLAVVGAIYVAIVALEVVLVLAIGAAFVTWAACALGAAIAYVQWDVARHNYTGRPSALTRRIAAAHGAWSDWLHGRRRGPRR